MEKSIAQALREFMDAVSEAPVVSYDFNTWITNPEPAKDAPDAEWDAWEEEREVGVNYSVSGKYYPATYEQPEEHPELDFTVHDLKTGEEVQNLDKATLDRIEQECWEKAESGGDDFPEPDRDDYRDHDGPY